MCDMPIPFGAEFDASAPGPFEKSSRDSEAPKSSPKVEPIRSAYVPRYTQSNNIHSKTYHPPKKSAQTSESLPSFSYYPGSYVTPSPSVPQQDYYFSGPPASNPQSMHQQMYGREFSTNYYQQQQLPSYQYQPEQLKPAAEQYSIYQNPGIIDPRVSASNPYDMRRNSHGTCEKCGSFCSSNSYNQNLMAMNTNSETQRFAEIGAHPEMAQPSRPYRFYYPPNSTNRKCRDHILF